jgi:hypothetical protein
MSIYTYFGSENNVAARKPIFNNMSVDILYISLFIRCCDFFTIVDFLMQSSINLPLYTTDAYLISISSILPVLYVFIQAIRFDVVPNLIISLFDLSTAKK